MKKKVRVLAIALVMAVALIGAGYAAWSTTITDNTILQTGRFKVVLEADADSSYYAGDRVYNFRYDANKGKYQEGVQSIEWKKYDTIDNGVLTNKKGNNYVYTLAPKPPAGDITGEDGKNKGVTECEFSFYNLHPGTVAYTRFEMRNDGTIGAKIKDVDVDIQYYDNGWKTIEDINNLPNDFPKNIKDAIEAMEVYPYFAKHSGSSTTSEPIVQNTKTDLKHLEGVLNKDKDKGGLVGTTLEPGITIWSADKNSDELESGQDKIGYLPVFAFKLPADALNDNTGMDTLFKVVVKFNFVQYNEKL